MPRRRFPIPDDLPTTLAKIERLLSHSSSVIAATRAAMAEQTVWVLTRTHPHPHQLTPSVFRRLDDAKRRVQSVEGTDIKGEPIVRWRTVLGDDTQWQSYPLRVLNGVDAWWQLDKCEIQEGE